MKISIDTVAGDNKMLIAELNDRYVGHLHFSDYSDIHIQMVYVEPEFRRRGIATAMFAETRRLYPETKVYVPNCNELYTEDGKALTYALRDWVDRCPPRK
jgi:GNAT superfamily N-acetyltransferase